MRYDATRTEDVTRLAPDGATKWALYYDWRWEVRAITKQTDKRVVVDAGNRSRHLMSTEVRAIGDEATLRAAAEKLTSSEALYREDNARSTARLAQRNAAIIASLQ